MKHDSDSILFINKSSALEQAKDIPTTSAPSPQDFTDAFLKVAEEVSSIVCILGSSGLSQMGWQSAQVAKEGFSHMGLEARAAYHR